jgi:tripartite-type tricarboxylate transporter receptor subunit TctC
MEGRLDRKWSRVAAAVTAALALGTGAAHAQLDLKGKTVTIYVGGGAGGGVDIFARTFAQHLPKHLPGEPQIVVSNMPGNGGIQAVQFTYNVAAKDGTAIGTTNAGPVVEPLMRGGFAANYEIPKFRWIGSLLKGDTVCAVWHGSKAKSLAHAQSQEVLMASTGATSAPLRSALLMNALIGTKFKPISGFHVGNALLAIERGEVEGICNTLSSMRTTRAHWLRDKQLVPLVQVAMTPDREFAHVPRAVDLLKSDEQRQMLEFYLLPYEFNNPYYLPPSASDAALATYRKAFDAVMADPAYRADAIKRGQNLAPHTGPQVEKLVARLYSMPKEIVRRTIEATTPAGTPKK